MFAALVLRPALTKLRVDSFSISVSCAMAIFFTVQSGLTVPFLISGLSGLLHALCVTHIVVFAAKAGLPSSVPVPDQGIKTD